MEDIALSAQSLIPVNDCVLVRLEEQYNNFSTHESKYDSRTHGIVVSGTIQEGVTGYALQGKRVYWEEYKEGARIRKGGELFCFIKYEDIRGFEEIDN